MINFIEYYNKKEKVNNYISFNLSTDEEYKDFFIKTEKYLHYKFPLSEGNPFVFNVKADGEYKLYKFKINFLNKIIKNDFDEFISYSKENYIMTYKNTNIVYKDICLSDKLKAEIKLTCEEVNLKLEQMKTKIVR